MTIKTTAIVLALFIASCNDSKTSVNEAKIKSLNEQSLKCIAIMNEADAKKTAATTSGDAAGVTAAQKTIDSAAMENAKIGQQLTELQEKK